MVRPTFTSLRDSINFNAVQFLGESGLGSHVVFFGGCSVPLSRICSQKDLLHFGGGPSLFFLWVILPLRCSWWWAWQSTIISNDTYKIILELWCEAMLSFVESLDIETLNENWQAYKVVDDCVSRKLPVLLSNFWKDFPFWCKCELQLSAITQLSPNSLKPNGGNLDCAFWKIHRLTKKPGYHLPLVWLLGHTDTHTDTDTV